MATFPADGVTAHDVLRAVDMALYAAKRGGRARALPAPGSGGCAAPQIGSEQAG